MLGLVFSALRRESSHLVDKILDKLIILLRKVVIASILLAFAAAPLGNQSLAHAITVSAIPGADSTIPGPDTDLIFTFNVRIDAKRSNLTLTRPDGSTSNIVILPNDNPALLTGRLSGLKAGAYAVRWQVLATDGHITRGDVNFTVAP